MNDIDDLNERLMANNMDPVYFMDELDTVLGEILPSEFLSLTSSGKFNPKDEYFEYEGYGKLQSYSTLQEVLDMYDDID